MSHNNPSTAGPQERASRPRRTTAMAAAALSLGMGALSLVAAPAAQAATSATVGPCTVTAERPYHNGKFSVSGKKMVVYPIRVSCKTGGVQVQIQQKLMEADPGTDETQLNWFTPSGTPLFFSNAGTRTVNSEYRLTNWDKFGNEEVYHTVRFRVVSNFVPSQWVTVTSPERSISA